MPKSRDWSIASAPCRLEWQPSRLLAALLLILGVLAGLSIVVSEIAPAAAWPLALAAVAYGFQQARAELRRPVRGLTIAAGEGAVTMDGERVADFEVTWRGPLAFLRWRDAQGLRHRLQFWPDRFPARDRRELRLAMIGRTTRMTAPAARSMAP